MKRGLVSLQTSLDTNWYHHLQLKGGVARPPPVEGAGYLRMAQSNIDSLQVEYVNAAALFKLHSRVTGGPKSVGEKFILFPAFLIAACILEGAFCALITWMILKTGFWLYDVYILLPSAKSHRGFVLRPLLKDKSERYGLLELHTPYNCVVFLILIGAIALSLNFITNTAKATESASFFESLFGSFTILLAVLVPLAAVYAGPIWLFERRLARMKQKELDDLARKAASAANTEESLYEILEEMDVVRKQTAWPRNDIRFKTLMVMAICLVALPWALMLNLIPKELEPYLSVLKWIESLMQSLCARIYPFG